MRSGLSAIGYRLSALRSASGVVWSRSAAQGSADAQAATEPKSGARGALGVAFASRLRPRHPQPTADSRQPKAKAGFSLVEVLLAIFILGIGVISVAALFPAGIAQQRLSGDDIMGPTVANHAMSVIRSKVRAEDFGSPQPIADPGLSGAAGDFTRTLRGDWGWMRPSLILPSDAVPRSLWGTIDIFSHVRTVQEFGGTPTPNVALDDLQWEDYFDWTGRLFGIPYSLDLYSAGSPPRFVITQQERYYPMHSQLLATASDAPRPQYVWDCMFRRYQGRIYVAIFVYRVSTPGGAAFEPFAAPAMLPNMIDMTGGDWPMRPWDIAYEDGRPIPEVRGFPQDEFDPLDPDQSWQAPRQWLLDQNNNTHRVVANRRPGSGDTGPNMVIELAQPLSPVKLRYRGTGFYNSALNPLSDGWPTESPHEYFANPSNFVMDQFPLLDVGVVSRFWFIPLEVPSPTGVEFKLTPVYVTVKEL